MRYQELPGTDLRPSAIALGTGNFGTSIDEASAFALLDAFVGAGGTLIDTAHVYAAWVEGGEGASETTLGRWLRSSGARDRVVLATKGGHPPIGVQSPPARLRPEDLSRDLKESLERLGVSQVDLYWLHRDDPDIPVGEILDAAAERVRDGQTRAIACSNWSPDRQRLAAAWSAHNGGPAFCASQIGWSLAWSEKSGGSGTLYMDQDHWSFHTQTGVPVVAYQSQAGGFFSGRYRPGVAPRASGIRSGVLDRYASKRNYARLQRAQDLARELGISANQVALAFLLHAPFPSFPIVGARTLEQLADSMGAVDVALSADQWALLESEGAQA